MTTDVLGPEAAAPVQRSKTPKWETDARDRLKNAIRRFAKPLAELVARDANEGDTRLFITDFLCDALGYDKYADLTTEYAVKGEFADYGVRVDKQLVAFIEVKRVTTKLAEKHLRQVQAYAVNEGVEWMILTNGVQWQVYHLTGGLPVTVDLALDVDLLGPEQVAKKADALFHITREGLRHHAIDELWKAKRLTSPKAIAHVLALPSVVTVVRRELGRAGYRAADAEVLTLIRSTLRTDCQ